MNDILYNYVEVKIVGKNIRHFIKKMHDNKINIYKINIKDNEAIVLIDYYNYDNLLKIKSYYEVFITNYLGYRKILRKMKNNKIKIIMVIFFLVIIIFLTSLTFNINIITNDKNMEKLLKEELKKEGIYKYSFVKKYSEIEKIKNKIYNKHQDKIEWLDIERKGTKYYIRFEPRINNNISSDTKIYDIIAKKSARILKLDIKSGQILKNINEYVNINDMIVSSDIKLFDEVKNVTSSSGNVYGEVWYKINVRYPINYYEEKKTKNKYQTISLNFLNKKLILKKHNYENQKNKTSYILKNILLPISLNLENINEIEIIDGNNYKEKALENGLNKIKDNLKDDEYIINYYILNETIKDNIYETNIFVTVCENIGILKERVVENEGDIKMAI